MDRFSQAYLSTDGNPSRADPVEAQVTFVGIIVLVVKLNNIVRAAYNACLAAIAFLFVDEHNSCFRILSDSSLHRADYDACWVFAVMAGHNPGCHGYFRIFTLAFLLYPQIIRYFVRFGRYIIHEFLVITAGYDACLAANTSTQIHHQA
jgi:hypothetical protein